jgi:hypothetical protein
MSGNWFRLCIDIQRILAEDARFEDVDTVQRDTIEIVITFDLADPSFL